MAKIESGFQIDVQPITEVNRFEVLARVRPFHDLLKLAKGREERELYDNLTPGAEAVFITTMEPEPTDVAVMVERLKTINIGGEQYNVLMRLLRAVALPGHEFAVVLTNEPIERLKPDGITGRTPNPIIPATDLKSPNIRLENMYPWGQFYTSEARELLVATLAGEGNSLAEANRVTGVCREVYPKGESRLFDPKRLKGSALRFYRRMITKWPDGLGARLDNGDGVRYILFPTYTQTRRRVAAETAISEPHIDVPISRLTLLATP